MNKQTIHTSTACFMPVPQQKTPRLALSDVLLRWLADVDAGKFRHPHVIVDGLILTRIRSIWTHCLLQEWFIETAMVTRPLQFKNYLINRSIVGSTTFEKTIDRVRHTGFVSVNRFEISRGMQEKTALSACITPDLKNTHNCINNMPTIIATQAWCCANGCGECKPKESEHEYHRKEDLQGNLIESKTEVIHVSHCCRAELLLWDQDKQNFVEWSYVEPDGSIADGAA